jgi:hypothetical protein
LTCSVFDEEKVKVFSPVFSVALIQFPILGLRPFVQIRCRSSVAGALWAETHRLAGDAFSPASAARFGPKPTA